MNDGITIHLSHEEALVLFEFFARFEAFAKANGLTAEGLARVALTKSAEEYLKEHPDE